MFDWDAAFNMILELLILVLAFIAAILIGGGGE